MKKLIVMLAAMLPLFVFYGCSDNEDKVIDGEVVDDGTGENDGKILSEIIVNEHEKDFGEISDKGELYEQYIYNQDGTLAEKTTNYYVSVYGDRVENRYEYSYDGEKRMVEQNEYQLGVLEHKYRYEYNDIDSISKMTVYDGSGDLMEEWTYEYDSQRRLIKSIEKDVWMSSDFGYVSEYTYDGNNMYVTTKQISDGSLFGRYEYEYDSKRNLLQKIYISGDTGRESVEEKHEYEYDSAGRIKRKSSKEYYSSDDWTYYDYTYNEDGTINNIHISYSYKDDESELRYNYYWE